LRFLPLAFPQPLAATFIGIFSEEFDYSMSRARKYR
jgi:hypothetical protein